jgi:outer membrane protein OmpA-like peptidoglycan-associated protein
MKLFNQVLRLVVLLMLLVIGIGLIWYVGNYLFLEVNISVPVPAPSRMAAVASKAALRSKPTDDLAPTATITETVLTAGKLPRLVATERGQFIATDAILFNSGASTLREASIPKLEKVAQLLKDNPEIHLEIIGHTDNLGNEPVNQRVSAERALAVMGYLISLGIAPARLKSKGMGSLDPISSNDTQLGRQANRRIEFLVVKPGAARSLGRESGK